MEVEPGGERQPPARKGGDQAIGSPNRGLTGVFMEHGRRAASEFLSMHLEPYDSEPNGGLLARERALRVLAEERAARAESGEASLRATFAVVASVAEASIEVAAHLVDEAHRYAEVMAEAVRQEHPSSIEAGSVEAMRVIAEARAAVAELRADLLDDDPDDEPVVDSEIKVEAIARAIDPHPRRWGWRRRVARGPGGAPDAALPQPDEASSRPARRPASVTPAAEGAS